MSGKKKSGRNNNKKITKKEKKIQRKRESMNLYFVVNRTWKENGKEVKMK